MSRTRENVLSSRGFMSSSSSIPFVNTISLPNIPRMTDDKSKVRYMTEYEKYEQELRRHHLGPPETSITMGLKDVVGEFDRSVPRINEPTAAEKEFERYLKLRNEARKRRNQFRPFVPRAQRKKPQPLVVVDEFRVSESQNGESNANEEDASAAKTTPVAADGESCAAKPSKDGEGSPPITAEAASLPKIVLAKRYVNPIRTPSTVSRCNSRERGVDSNETETLKETPQWNPERKRSPERKRLPRASAQEESSPPRTQAPPGMGKELENWLKDELNKISPTQTYRKIDLKPDANDPKPSEMDANVCAELLRILLCPQDKYSESVGVSMDHMDLTWLKKNRQPPINLKSIQDLRPLCLDNIKDGAALPILNSPRSVLVLLRNGVAVNDLQPAKIASEEMIQRDSELLCLASSARIDQTNPNALLEMMHSYRLEWDKKRRTQLFAFLLEDYHQLCGQVSLNAIVEAFQIPPNLQETRPLSISFEQRRERLQKVFATNKARMEKNLSMTNLLSEQKKASERHRLQVQAEARAAMAEKALKEAQAREKQRERLEAQQLKKRQMEEVFQRMIEEKLAKAAQRNRERQEAKERLYTQQRLKQVALSARHSQRFERNAEMQLRMEEEVERRRVEKEAKIDFMKFLQLERLAKEREEQRVLQMKAAREREAMLRRIAERQAATLEAAILRQQKAEAHLQEFRKKCEEERAARATEEEERRKRRLQASAKAVELHESLRSRIMEKVQERDKAYMNIQREGLFKRAVHREQEREIEAVRSFAVLQKQRVKAFCRLHTILDLMEKERIAEQVEKQREEVLEENRKIKEVLSKERENLQRKFKVE
ncbi:unnamed protein product [Phytomonas sp. EM1]|nr:unnamed protein product [Phytomonas sp. EM1]|eukprot:CCW65652.1 unnamed protein product [Phytomonas sp. isolate EM1]